MVDYDLSNTFGCLGGSSIRVRKCNIVVLIAGKDLLNLPFFSRCDVAAQAGSSVRVKPVNGPVGFSPSVRAVGAVGGGQGSPFSGARHPATATVRGVRAGSATEVVDRDSICIRIVDDACVEVVRPAVSKNQRVTTVTAVGVVQRLRVIYALEG